VINRFNTEDYSVIYTGPKTKEEIEQEETEQRKVLELQQKMRHEEEERDRLRKEQKLASESPKPDTKTIKIDTVELLPNTNNSEISSHDVWDGDYDDEGIHQAIQLSLLEYGHQQQILNRHRHSEVRTGAN